MPDRLSLKTILPAAGGTPDHQVTLFALLNLGLTDSLAHGLLSATEALQVFYHAENCLFVRKQLRDKTADQIMSHGVQLADLFETLPMAESQREFQRELMAMRALCLKLLEEKQLVA
jgi:hypothetical protein